MKSKLTLTTVAALLMAFAVVGPAAGRDEQGGPALDRALAGPSQTKRAKLAPQLAAVALAADEGDDRGALVEARGARLSVVGERVQVVVEARGTRAGAIAAVARVGGTVDGAYANLVQARVLPAEIDALAADPGVAYVREPLVPQTASIPGEGVPASGANVWHEAARNGAGVGVAVIDVGFAGLAERQAAGDLPPSVTTLNLCAGGFAKSSHGTAVAEIVHEVAPAAPLTLICIDGDVGLGRAKDYVLRQRIPIVNTSLGWVDSSRGDGTGGPGTPEAIVADARKAGVLWISSAGNAADAHWSGTFADPDGDRLLNFTSADEGNAVTIRPSGRVCVKLKWDSWPTSRQDFDLYVVHSLTGAVLAESEGLQTGTQPPRERACVENGEGSPLTVVVVIAKHAATLAPRFDLWAENHVLEHRNADGSINEPASSPAALAVGAICWHSRGLEPYSSQGPTIDGRTKPDIAAYASVSSGTYGQFTSCTASGFVGTSASAPHVAGAAALVKQANPAFGPAELQSFLEARAIDLGAPAKDNAFGAGALSLTGVVPPPAVPSPPPAVTPPPPPVAAACRVPGLRGKTLTAARRALARAYCALGRTTRAYSPRVRRGRVIRQSVAAARRLATGSRVNVTLSRGPRS
jgi:subtilase family protein/PASTA domain-containing protein